MQPTRTHQIGWSFLRLSDVQRISPGKLGENWRPFVQGYQFTREGHEGHVNRKFWYEQGGLRYDQAQTSFSENNAGEKFQSSLGLNLLKSAPIAADNPVVPGGGSELSV